MEPTYQDYLNACAAGDLETVERALAVLSIEDYNEGFRNAAMCGHLNVVNRLLEIDKVLADATAQDNRALIYAASNGDLNVVNRLLEIDKVLADATAQDNYALRFAAYNGHLNVVNRLLQIPEVRENATALKNNALCNAVRMGHADITIRLLQEENVADYLRLHQQDFIAMKKGHFKEIEERRFARIVAARSIFNNIDGNERQHLATQLAPGEKKETTHSTYFTNQALTYLYHDVLCGNTACFKREEDDSKFITCKKVDDFRKSALGAKDRAQAKLGTQATTYSSATSSTEPAKKARIN